MGLAQYSLSNQSNSVAEYLAAELLAKDYLLYWRTIDALQTVDGVYGNFYANQATILADSNVADELANSRGILTVLNMDAADPALLKRPTNDGGVVTPIDVPLPSIVISVGHLPNGGLLGIGSKMRERYTDLQLIGYGRSFEEQLYLTEVLRGRFDESLFIPMYDHDAGTRAVVPAVEIQDVEFYSAVVPLEADVQAYEIALTARLRYEA
jgi:hypothetical protein